MLSLGILKPIHISISISWLYAAKSHQGNFAAHFGSSRNDDKTLESFYSHFFDLVETNRNVTVSACLAAHINKLPKGADVTQK